MIVRKENNVLIMEFNRPEAMNSLTPDVVQTFIEAMRGGAEDPDVRTAVLTGTGSTFSSGMDINVFKNRHYPENHALLHRKVPEMFNTLIDFPKPIIGGANGMGVGFGFTVLCLLDVVIMAESAKFMLPFTNLGLSPEACASHTFPRLFGWQKASWLLYSGEWITAQECKEAGLALEVVADDELLDSTLQHANKLAEKSLTSLMLTKKALMAPYRDALYEANRLEIEAFGKNMDHPASEEGVSAFLEKRLPEFRAKGL